MIKIGDKTTRKLSKFWNNCLFHPTDAIEDPWGKRILDRMSDDGAIDTVRIYTMFEDIVYEDGNGELAYDFRLTDLRLDYMLEKGYKLLLAYGMMPECIASDKGAKATVCKNKTRYKGKTINTSPPSDYRLWEEVCYTYTKHIVERYGTETVSKWRLQCLNEADIPMFFMSDVSSDMVEPRIDEYKKIYEGFASGIMRVSDKLKIGGPALAHQRDFLELFLTHIKESKTRLDFISVHNYGATGVWKLCNEYKGFNTDKWINEQTAYFDIIEKCGFKNTEVIVDEWGMAGQGFYNIEECPYFIARENEVFSAFYAKLIAQIIEKDWSISKLMLCLSGQHEMVTDFSGFRNFFTLNFFAKPIYSAHVLASKLFDELVDFECENKNIFAVPTKGENGECAILLTYSSPDFDEDAPDTDQELILPDFAGENVTVYCIDKAHTNPFRLYERLGLTPQLSDEDIKKLKDEGNIKPFAKYQNTKKIKIRFSANSVFLVVCKSDNKEAEL